MHDIKKHDLKIGLVAFVAGVVLSGIKGFPDGFKQPETYLWFCLALAINLAVFIYTFRLRLIEAGEKLDANTGRFERLEKQYTQLTQAVQNGIAVHGATGYLVPLAVNADLWNFDGTISGLNPNWALEFNEKTTPTRTMLEMHKARLKLDTVKHIRYIFLDGYGVENNGHALMFGHQHFLEYLNSEIGPTFHKQVLEKYEVWIIPESAWRTPSENMRKTLSPQTNAIFISGFHSDKPVALVFPNNSPFLSSTGHTHCIQVRTSSISYHQIFDEITRALQSEGIQKKKITFNQTTKEYALL